MLQHIVATGNIGDLPIAVLSKIWKVVDDEMKAARADVATKINKVFRGWRTRLNMSKLVIGNPFGHNIGPGAVWNAWFSEIAPFSDTWDGVPTNRVRKRSERLKTEWHSAILRGSRYSDGSMRYSGTPVFIR